MSGDFGSIAQWMTAIPAAVGALVTVVGAVFAAYRWYLKQQVQDRDIERIKEEDALIVYALTACLDGLEQLGANHSVSAAKEKLEKYINKQAHK